MGIIVVRQSKYSRDIYKKNTENSDKGLRKKKKQLFRIKPIMVISAIAWF